MAQDFLRHPCISELGNRVLAGMVQIFCAAGTTGGVNGTNGCEAALGDDYTSHPFTKSSKILTGVGLNIRFA